MADHIPIYEYINGKPKYVGFYSHNNRNLPRYLYNAIDKAIKNETLEYKTGGMTEDVQYTTLSTIVAKENLKKFISIYLSDFYNNEYGYKHIYRVEDQ